MSGAALDVAGARIEAARARLCIDAPFWGALGLYLKLERRDDIGTMATDGTRLIYAPAFVLILTDAALAGVIVHEIAHCALLHHTRRGGRDPKGWNIAADYAVNDWILSAGFTLPPDRLHDKRFSGMGAEEIYSILARRQQAQQANAGQSNAAQSGAGQQSNAPAQGASAGAAQGNAPAQGAGAPSPADNAPGNGGTGNGAPAPGNAQGNASGASAGAGAGAPGDDIAAPAWGAVLDAAPDHDAAGRAEIEAAWSQRVRMAAAIAGRAAGAGNMPAALQRLIADLEKPRHNWRDVLRKYADNGSRRENSWARPSRRYGASGLYLPAQVSVNPCRLVFVIDSSGSMYAPAIRELVSEAAAMLETGAADVVNVLCVNTRVVQAREFTGADAGDLAEFMPAPSGGTRFAPAFDWVRDNAPDAAAVIYATDLDCRDYGEEPAAPVLWLKTPTARAMPAPPFGEVFPLDPDA